MENEGLTTMTEKDIERLAELIAIKVNERYLEIVKKMIAASIKLHVAECAAGKYLWIRSLVSSVVGGVVVGVILYFLK